MHLTHLSMVSNTLGCLSTPAHRNLPAQANPCRSKLVVIFPEHMINQSSLQLIRLCAVSSPILHSAQACLAPSPVVSPGRSCLGREAGARGCLEASPVHVGPLLALGSSLIVKNRVSADCADSFHLYCWQDTFHLSSWHVETGLAWGVLVAHAACARQGMCRVQQTAARCSSFGAQESVPWYDQKCLLGHRRSREQ